MEHAEAKAEKFLNILDPAFYINNDDGREIPETETAGISLLDDTLLLEDEHDNRQALMEQKAADSGLLPPLEENRAYQYEFHYLDLLDAYNGNVWVSAEYGTTVWLPYPEGTSFRNGIHSAPL